MSTKCFLEISSEQKVASHFKHSIICTNIKITWDPPRMNNERCLNLLAYAIKFKVYSYFPAAHSYNGIACNNTIEKSCKIQLPGDLNSPTFSYEIISLYKNNQIGSTSKEDLRPNKNCKIFFNCR